MKMPCHETPPPSIALLQSLASFSLQNCLAPYVKLIESPGKYTRSKPLGPNCVFGTKSVH